MRDKSTCVSIEYPIKDIDDVNDDNLLDIKTKYDLEMMQKLVS